MFRIFVGLAVFGVLLLVGECILGYASPGNVQRLGEHILLGVGAGVYLCGLHTLCMFHLIGTAKDTKEAARVLPEYQEIVAAIRDSKMRVFPIITLTILVTIATVVLGGGIHTGALPRWIHSATVALTLALNIWTFVLEYHAVKNNLLLLTLVDYKVEQIAGREEPSDG
jgi:hypothetical protein